MCGKPGNPVVGLRRSLWFVIFFDEESSGADEVPACRGWRYAATNGSVFVVLVTLAILGFLALATLVVFSRVILSWVLTFGMAVWNAF
ncbi:hypothetical protein GCM10027280_56200 [Micromonospora polyrhachis]